MINKQIKILLLKSIPSRLSPKNHLISLIKEKACNQVIQGIFSGLQYVNDSVGSAYLPKLLGTYEQELHPVIEEIIHKNFSYIINIGAGEGYYAIGLARRLKEARVDAYESDERGRHLLTEMSVLNSVQDQVRVYAHCGIEDLRQSLSTAQKTLVLCDVEGSEGDLLDMTHIPSLAQSYILVELHESMRPGVTTSLKMHFANTHEIMQIWQQNRTATDFPFTNLSTRLLPNHYLRWAMNEKRPERMSWLWMRPKFLAQTGHVSG
jgi:hypothetical protein